MPTGVVLGLLQIDARLQHDLAPLYIVPQGDAFERRAIDVLRRAVKVGVTLEHDQIIDTVAINNRSCLLCAGDVIETRFNVARLFGHQVRVGKTGKVEIVEGWRLERSTRADRRAERRREAVTVG